MLILKTYQFFKTKLSVHQALVTQLWNSGEKLRTYCNEGTRNHRQCPLHISLYEWLVLTFCAASFSLRPKQLGSSSSTNGKKLRKMVLIDEVISLVTIYHFSMSTISSFKSIESKHDIHRGKDCMKRFCESLK